MTRYAGVQGSKKMVVTSVSSVHLQKNVQATSVGGIAPLPAFLSLGSTNLGLIGEGVH
jgi:hypothetical protein